MYTIHWTIKNVQVTRHYVSTHSSEYGLIIDRHSGVPLARWQLTPAPAPNMLSLPNGCWAAPYTGVGWMFTLPAPARLHPLQILQWPSTTSQPVLPPQAGAPLLHLLCRQPPQQRPGNNSGRRWHGATLGVQEETKSQISLTFDQINIFLPDLYIHRIPPLRRGIRLQDLYLSGFNYTHDPSLKGARHPTPTRSLPGTYSPSGLITKEDSFTKKMQHRENMWEKTWFT